MKHSLTAERLRMILELRGMRAQELAKKSGVNKSSISHYVNGSHTPSKLSSIKMSEVLGVSPLWLMGFDVDMEPDGNVDPNTDARELIIRRYGEDSLKFIELYVRLDQSERSELRGEAKQMLKMKGIEVPPP